MTYEQFVEAAKYAVSTLDPEQVEYGWYVIGKTHLYDLPEEIESALIDGMDEWCNDNDIDPDEWQEEWGVIDVWCDGQKDDDVFGVGKQRINPDKVDENVLKNYMCEQADFTFRLCGILRQRLLSEHMVTVYEHFDRPLAATLFEMEKNKELI